MNICYTFSAATADILRYLENEQENYNSYYIYFVDMIVVIKNVGKS